MLTELSVAVLLLFFYLFGGDVYGLIAGTIRPFFSPLKDVPGPRPSGFIYGSLKEIMEADPAVLHEKWFEEYGKVMKYKVLFNRDRLCTADSRAIGHILKNTNDYQKPEPVRVQLSAVTGHGLLTAEGEAHKQQRRILNPAFGTNQIRELTSVFLDKSIQLRDIWASKLASNELEKKSDSDATGKIEVVRWLSAVTLDIIGLAGFNYDFNSLEPNEHVSELNQAFRNLLVAGKFSLLDILHALIPATRVLKSKRDKEVVKARAVIDRVGAQFLADRKATARATMSDDQLAKNYFQGKDLLSLLVKANMANDVPEFSRLPDEDVLAQIPTFLLAGHETTSTAVTWILYALSLHPPVQDKLREEILSCNKGERPSMEELGDLPYLDAVVRETLRWLSPVPNTLRVAMKDDVIPTECEWVDKNGVRRSGIPISKGDTIYVPILPIGRSKEIWGEDASEYKPERWTDLPSGAASLPGIWGNTLAFSGGFRACIGYRFSVVEIKVLVYTLIRAFKFSLAIDPSEMKMKQSAVIRPHLKENVEAGAQLPLWVSAVEVDD